MENIVERVNTLSLNDTYVIEGARRLERSHFNDYKGQPVVDLTRNSCSFIPKWLAEFPNIKKLIVDVNSARFALGFEAGFPETIQVEIKNMQCIPDDLLFDQVIGAVEFRENHPLTVDPEFEYLVDES
jgi:hypothetical protein